MGRFSDLTVSNNNSGDKCLNNVPDKVENIEEDTSLIELFVDYVIQSNYRKEEKEKLIRWLAYNKGYDEIKYQWNVKHSLRFILPTLRACKGDVNYATAEGKTILHEFLAGYAKTSESCSNDQSQKDIVIIETLIKNGASIIVLDCDGNSPLGMAIIKERFDLVKIMLKCSTSADLNNQNILGETILHIIIDNYAKINDNWEYYFKYIKEIHNLVCYGANINQPDFTGRTPLHYAVKHCFVEMLQLFKQLGGDFNALTNVGDNLLMTLCFESRRIEDSQVLLKAINLLLEEECDVKHRNNSGFTCLHYAAQSHRLAVVERLVKAGADVNATAEDGSTPLHVATMIGTVETVKCLLDRGANWEKRENVYGFTVLHTAALNRDEKVLQKVCRNGLKIELSNMGLSALHLAVICRNYEVVKMLIQVGVSVNSRDKDGQSTPLHLAAMGSQFSNLKTWFDYRWTCFSLIRKCLELIEPQGEFNSILITDALAEARADVNAKDTSGRVPLHFAALRDDHRIVRSLLTHNALVDVQDNEGLLPLHYVLKSGNLKGFECLIQFGADVNDIENPCNTFMEIMSWQKPIANHLLKHVVKLRAADLPVSNVYTTYLRHSELLPYAAECLREVKKLKNLFLTDTYISFYSLLQRNSKRQFTLIDRLPFDFVITQFPIYGSVIIGSYRAYFTRNSQLQLAKSALEQITIGYWPDLCVDHIFSYLNNKDLRALVDNMENMLRRKFKMINQIEQKGVRSEPSSFRIFRVYELRRAFRVADKSV